MTTRYLLVQHSTQRFLLKPATSGRRAVTTTDTFKAAYFSSERETADYLKAHGMRPSSWYAVRLTEGDETPETLVLVRHPDTERYPSLAWAVSPHMVERLTDDLTHLPLTTDAYDLWSHAVVSDPAPTAWHGAMDVEVLDTRYLLPSSLPDQRLLFLQERANMSLSRLRETRPEIDSSTVPEYPPPDEDTARPEGETPADAFRRRWQHLRHDPAERENRRTVVTIPTSPAQVTVTSLFALQQACTRLGGPYDPGQLVMDVAEVIGAEADDLADWKVGTWHDVLTPGQKGTLLGVLGHIDRLVRQIQPRTRQLDQDTPYTLRLGDETLVLLPREADAALGLTRPEDMTARLELVALEVEARARRPEDTAHRANRLEAVEAVTGLEMERSRGPLRVEGLGGEATDAQLLEAQLQDVDLDFNLTLQQLAVLLRPRGEKLPLEVQARERYISRRSRLYATLPAQVALEVRSFFLVRSLRRFLTLGGDRTSRGGARRQDSRRAARRAGSSGSVST